MATNPIITEFFFFHTEILVKFYSLFASFWKKFIIPLAPSYESSLTNFGEILHMKKHSGPDLLEK